MIESGVTTVQHLHGRLGGPLDRLLAGAEAVIGAYRQIGMRVSYSFGIRDQNRLVYEADERFVAGLSADLQEPARDLLAGQVVEVDLALELFEGPASPARGQRAGRDPARADQSPLVFRRRARADRRYVPAIRRADAHASPRDPLPEGICRRRTGTTALRHLERLGMLGPRLTLGHGVWLEGEDIELMAATGTCICHNASSNLRLASGIAPLAAASRLGA